MRNVTPRTLIRIALGTALAQASSITSGAAITVDPGAPNDSLYISSSGNIGIDTTTPATELQITDGDTPTLRLQQDGSSGFTAQTWDVAGNESNFFVRDVTNSSSLPFRIQPGAPESSIYIREDGNVGFGYASAAKRVDIRGSDADASSDNDIAVRVNNTSGTTATRVLLNLENNGGVRFDMLDRSTNDNWVFQNQLGTFDVTLAGTGTREFRFYPNGNLEISGSLIQASSREIKNNILPVDQQSVLERVVALPINSWSYKKEQGVTHIGPIAEDFYQSFGLGSTPKGISSVDTGGVALAAIQGLYTQLQHKDAVISEQQSRIEDQQIRLAKLEAAVAELLAREDGFAAR